LTDPQINLTFCQAIGLYKVLSDLELDLELSYLMNRIEKTVLCHLTLDERMDLEKTYELYCNKGDV